MYNQRTQYILMVIASNEVLPSVVVVVVVVVIMTSQFLPVQFGGHLHT